MFTRREIEQSIAARFEKQVAAYPDRTAIVADGAELRYDELNQLANRFAHSILGLEGESSEPVALMLEQGAALVAAILGALKAGKIYVPLEPEYPRSKIERMIEHSGARLVVTERTELLSDATQNPKLDISPDAPAYIFYTSGSTGEPKGVVDSHRNVLHNIMRYTNGLDIRADDRLTLLQSCSFSGSVSSLFSALLNGAAVYPINPRQATGAELAAWVNRHQLTMWHSVPSLFRQLCLGRTRLPSVRMIRLEGDTASPGDVSLYQRFFSDNCTLVNGLGATETGITRRYFIDKSTEVGGGVLPVGYPVEDMEVFVLDEDGEIAVKSKYLAMGYWRQPELTARRFLTSKEGDGTRIYLTGDVGRMRSDGCLEHLGRKDFRTKIRGHGVEVAEVESALCAVSEIEQAVVAVRENPNGEKSLVGYFVTAEGHSAPSVSHLRRSLGGTLPDYAIPPAFVALQSLPLTENGKVDRRRLPAPDSARPEVETPFAPAQTPNEELLARLWSEILDVDGVGIDDSFFDLGGDSLAASRVLARIDLPVSALLRGPTVRRLAEELDRADDGVKLRPAGSPVPLNRAEGNRPPLFCVPGHDGGLLGYSTLARYLAGDQPVFGFEPPDPDDVGVRYKLEDLAARYVDHIRRLRPEGPCLLSGLCFGGLVAQEMACQMARQGSEVSLLVMVDCPSVHGGSPRRRDTLRHIGRRLKYHWRAMLRADGAAGYLKRRIAEVVDRAREQRNQRAFDTCVRENRTLPAHLRLMQFANHAAAENHKPRPYSGRTMLIGASDPRAGLYPAPLMGWEGTLLGEVTFYEVSDDLAGLFAEPAVRQVARLLMDAIPSPK